MGLSTNGKPISRWEGSWAERTIYAAGRRAFLAGVRYEDNPQAERCARLAWSKGFNDQRVQRLQPGALSA
jgi:hypothetical protein